MEIGSDNLKSDRIRMEFSWIFDFGSVRIGNALIFGFRKSDLTRKNVPFPNRTSRKSEWAVLLVQPNRFKTTLRRVAAWSRTMSVVSEAKQRWVAAWPTSQFASTLKHVVRTLLKCVHVLRSVESQLNRHRKFALKWKHVVKTILIGID